MDKKLVLVTGATGFIGRPLCAALYSHGFRVRIALRKPEDDIPACHEQVLIGEIGPDTEWTGALRGVDMVLHLAGRAHIMKDDAAEPLAEFRRVNVSGTQRLAYMAAKQGIKTFIFLSSVKVNGEHSETDFSGRIIPFTEGDTAYPQDSYGLSKWEAEQALNRIKEELGLESVILRCPLVYGPGAKANFLQLLKTVDKGIPLPFGNVSNLRSMVYTGNLIDIIVKCMTDGRAKGQTFLVSDGRDISTPELIRMIAKAMGKKPKLFSFPLRLLRFLGKISGKTPEIDRLTGSLCIDNQKIIKTLGWNPPYSLKQGVRETVEYYKSQ